MKAIDLHNAVVAQNNPNCRHHWHSCLDSEGREGILCTYCGIIIPSRPPARRPSPLPQAHSQPTTPRRREVQLMRASYKLIKRDYEITPAAAQILRNISPVQLRVLRALHTGTYRLINRYMEVADMAPGNLFRGSRSPWHFIKREYPIDERTIAALASLSAIKQYNVSDGKLWHITDHGIAAIEAIEPEERPPP
jgi:hypothetical protein